MTAGLRNKLSSEGVTVKKVDPKTGKKTVSGGPKLKSTEEYPRGFGRTLAIRHIFGKDKKRGLLKCTLKIAEKKLPLKEEAIVPLDWSHAELDELKCFLRAEAAAGKWTPLFSEGL